MARGSNFCKVCSRLGGKGKQLPCRTHLILCTAVLIAHLDSDVQDHTAIKERSLEEKKKLLMCCKRPSQNKTTKNPGNFGGLSSQSPCQLPLLTFSLTMILSHKLGGKDSKLLFPNVSLVSSPHWLHLCWKTVLETQLCYSVSGLFHDIWAERHFPCQSYFGWTAQRKTLLFQLYSNYFYFLKFLD